MSSIKSSSVARPSMSIPRSAYSSTISCSTCDGFLLRSYFLEVIPYMSIVCKNASGCGVGVGVGVGAGVGVGVDVDAGVGVGVSKGIGDSG